MLIPQLFDELAVASPAQLRGSILALQAYLKQSPAAVSEEVCTLRHIFAPGNYARELTMPAGLVVIGKLHRHAHLNFISRGHVRVLTEGGVVEYKAPCSFVSEPGTKRVVLVIEETTWTTVHPTEETDLEKIEEYVIAQDYADIELPGECMRVQEVLCLGGQ